METVSLTGVCPLPEGDDVSDLQIGEGDAFIENEQGSFFQSRLHGSPVIFSFDTETEQRQDAGFNNEQ